MAENKVHLNLQNVHYAVLTESIGTGGAMTYSYGTPVHVPGAVSLDLQAQSDANDFYADGLIYYSSRVNAAYEGDLEMARFPEQMLQDVWKFIKNSTDKTLIEKAGTEFAYFALLFEIEGDADNDLYCFYKCKATNPGVNAATSTDTKEPQTQSCTITTMSRADKSILARTTADTTSTVRASWFDEVYEQTDSSSGG